MLSEHTTLTKTLRNSVIITETTDVAAIKEMYITTHYYNDETGKSENRLFGWLKCTQASVETLSESYQPFWTI